MRERVGGRGPAVWVVGLLVYVLAVFHRSSLAVAGLDAADRFGINAAQLASFTTLQLLVYAGMQIPVGLLLDRFGSRRMLTVGLVLLTVSQIGFALTESYLGAVVCRVGVGVGDALTFVCVLRLVNRWFAPTRVPLVTQLTGVLGPSGAILAAVPMTWSLQTLGWTRTYLAAAGLGVVLMVALLVVIHDSPERRALSGPRLSWTTIRASLVDSWEHPGTRLGFWTHFTTQFSATTMSLLWGYPFLVRGQGLTPAEAGALLTVLVVAIMVAGPVLGVLITRHPWYRSTLVLGIVAVIATVWTVVLLWSGPAPAPLLVLLVVVVGIGAPASMIGFDFGRSFNPAHRLGTATGIINQGGFVASLLVVVAIGVVLDALTPGDSDAFSPESFRVAMSVQYVLWAVGAVQIWRLRRRSRARLLADDPDVYRQLRRPR